jgi:serine/threonine protein kinase
MGDESTGGSGTGARQDPLVGRRLASYEVLARVARGGMGVVYRARHVYIDKIVALKVLDPALAERADLIERFRTEAQSLARVEHENVVKVIDILEDKGVHFIVMDFAEGTNLRVLVKEKGPMSGEDLLSVARQTAEALYAAHREGILHRDIKPENLIMNSRGRCKLADFGLAGDLRLITEGHEGPLNFGTPAYTSPEVMRRMVPDKRSDVFGFGATLYFLATGEPPFGQTGAQAIMLHQKQGAELLDGRRPDLPPKFTQLIMDCIQYHPKDRPGGFLEILDALPKRMVTRRVEAAATGPTDATDPTQLDSGTHETPALRQPSNRLLAGLVIAAVAVILLVLVFWIAPMLSRDDKLGMAINTAPQNNRPANRLPASDSNAPANQPEQPTFKPEDEAFNAAELDSRAALGNADYVGAYGAWVDFIRMYPKSAYVAEAQNKQNEVSRRVAELRTQEYDKAKAASDEALKEKRTADALAALNRFPKELLEVLSATDDLAVAAKLDLHRQNVLDVEAADVGKLIEKAEALRAEWQRDRVSREVDDSRRRRSAGNLLRERDLLEVFLPGRTQETQDRIELRLAELRRESEATHQESVARVDEWRRFHDEALGIWAEKVLKQIEGAAPLLERRDIKAVLKQLDQLTAELTTLRNAAAAGAKQPELAERIKRSTFVSEQMEAWRSDLLLADRVTIALENSLRDIKTSGVEREFLVHAEIDAEGVRSTRINKYTGRVVTAATNECVIEDDGERVTISYSMLTVTSMRKLVGGGDSHDAQASLIAWLVAIGRVDDAQTEFARLEKMEFAPADVTTRARASIAAAALAPEAVQRLRYLAIRSGIRDAKEAALLTEGSLLRRLADAHAGVMRGDDQALKDYIAAVGEAADPELVSLEAFSRAATETGELSDGLVAVWTAQLEPLNPAAWSALAERALARNPAEAKEHAGHALILDGSNEAAWKIVK